jgi:hypothetical protein
MSEDKKLDKKKIESLIPGLTEEFEQILSKHDMANLKIVGVTFKNKSNDAPHFETTLNFTESGHWEWRCHYTTNGVECGWEWVPD